MHEIQEAPILTVPSDSRPDVVIIKCPTCAITAATTRCVCGGRGELVIDLNQFDGFEVLPVALYDFFGDQAANYTDPRGCYFEPINEVETPTCWAVYGHFKVGHIVSIADLPTEDDACDFAELLVGLTGAIEIKEDKYKRSHN